MHGEIEVVRTEIKSVPTEFKLVPREAHRSVHSRTALAELTNQRTN